MEDVNRDNLPEQVQVSKKARRQEENDFCLGGMRNPQLALDRMAVLAEAGMDMTRLWKAFVEGVPEALEPAKTYGTDRCELDRDVLKVWESQVRKLLKAEASVVLREKPHVCFSAQVRPLESLAEVLKGPGDRCGNLAKQRSPFGNGRRDTLVQWSVSSGGHVA